MAIKKYYTLFYLQSLCTQIFSKAYMYSNLTSLLQKYTPDSTPLLFINLKWREIGKSGVWKLSTMLLLSLDLKGKVAAWCCYSDVED